MPTYSYRRADGTEFEIEQKISEDALTVCPTTGLPVERIITSTSFQLKGSGWYKTDYPSSGSAGTAKSNRKTSGSGGSGGGCGGGCACH